MAIYDDTDDGENKTINIIVITLSFLVIAALFIGFGSTTYKDVSQSHLQFLTNSSSRAPPLIASKSSMQRPENPQNPNLGSICTKTDYPSTCQKSLSSFSNNTNATIQDYIKASIGMAIREMKEAKKLSKLLVKKRTVGKDYQAINDCIEMISLALDDLQEAFSLVSDVSRSSADIKNWLSAVLSYQQACLEGISAKKSKTSMENVFESPKQKIANSLAMIDDNMKHNESQLKSRKIEEYPSWFSGRFLEENESSSMKPDVVVDGDGSGKFRTIGEALKAYKLNEKGWFVIYVKSGEYNENVLISEDQRNVYMYGDGYDKTVVYGSLHSQDGFPPYRTATFAVLGDGFVCKSIGIQNRAKSDKTAVALRIQADKSTIFNCKIEASVRSLHALAHRQFYRNCTISGTRDLIVGDSSTIIQHSQILIKKPDTQTPHPKVNAVVVQGRTEKSQPTGFVLQSCRIVEDKKCLGGCFTYLGRAAGDYSRIVIMWSDIGHGISPEGWTVGSSDGSRRIKVEFLEYENSGPGADTTTRVKWDGFQEIRSQSKANRFHVYNFIQGNLWLPRTGVPFIE